MKYNLFLFDLDDTLLDFKASERLSFEHTLHALKVEHDFDSLFGQYQLENRALWDLFEQGKTSKEHLKVERFRKIFTTHQLDIDADMASEHYLSTLPRTVVLIEHAVEICQWLCEHGEIGIITNGIHHVQTERIKNSALAPFISFVSVSEECGHAKPDVRFFDFSANKARSFDKKSALVIGDRFEADIVGASTFGVSSCWFNPDRKENTSEIKPTYEITHLSELRRIVSVL